jgi:putative transposase
MSRIERRVKQAGVYFVTTDTWERRQIFLKPGPAQIVLAQLLDCRERGFYKLHAFVVMPEHLHILMTPGEEVSIEKAVQMIKGGSAFRIRKELMYTSPIWQRGYHDRWIRDDHEYRIRKQYIEFNPVKARLVERPGDYPSGSASGKFKLDPSIYDREGASGAKAHDASTT